jgi:uncharacterized protein (TIGR02598 family)
MKSQRTHHGFSLVEVTLAMGIAAFCLLVIFALLPTGLNSNQTSIQQTEAASLAAALVADLRATPVTSNSSPTYKLDPGTVTAKGTNATIYLFTSGKKAGSASEAAGSETIYKAVLTFHDDATVPSTKFVNIQIQAPAAAAKPNTVFEASTALDRRP